MWWLRDGYCCGLTLGFFAGSSSSGLSACCKIKRKSTHAHSKSEMAGPLCTVCVLRAPHCRKKAWRWGDEAVWWVLGKRYMWGLLYLSQQLKKWQVSHCLFFLFYPFIHSVFACVFVLALQVRGRAAWCLWSTQNFSRPAGGSITWDNYKQWRKCVCQIN